MKLTDQEFKRFKELQKLEKAGKLSDKEKQELESLSAKKKDGSTKTGFVPGNDFSWWNKIPELLKDSANYKCNWIPGTPMARGRVSDVGVGLMRIVLDSICGVNTSSVDPINVWARDLYLRMFQKYRPASGYTASDLGITILSGIEAVKLIAYYERIYGIINRYSKLNVNMPEEEALALGLSASQMLYLQGHLSDFRYDLNYLIRKAQRLCVPKDLSAVAQAISLFGYEYADHDGPRAQIILFTLHNFGVYSDVAVSTGGSIKYDYALDANLFDFNANNMCKALDIVLTSLLGSDSIQRICADLVVWFGQGAMLEFLPIPEDYIVVPVRNESILHEIHNMETPESNTYRILSFADNALPAADVTTVGSDHYIYQVDDRIVTAVGLVDVPGGASVTPVNATINGVQGTIGYSSGPAVVTLDPGHILDVYHEDFTLEHVSEGTVFKFSATNATDTAGNCAILDTGIFYIVREVAVKKRTGIFNNFSTVSTSSYAESAAGYFACIDWAPLCMNYNPVTKIITSVFGDYDNIVILSASEVERVQRTMLLSALHTDMQVVNK